MKKLGPSSPSFKDVLIDGEPRKVNIISATVTNKKYFHTMPGEDFVIGSIMEWSNSHWLITERDAEDENYSSWNDSNLPERNYMAR